MLEKINAEFFELQTERFLQNKLLMGRLFGKLKFCSSGLRSAFNIKHSVVP